MNEKYGENNSGSSSDTETVVNLAFGTVGELEVKVFMRKDAPPQPGENPRLEAIQRAIELLEKQAR
ncbi:hypothetical protein [Stenotrophomonas lacuserhaii]|uniref:hypothetical protein n=1 Tax=Stenotrophomonas lacuserhaii TaxID=2760084 RepID=UPI0015FBCD8A|nr:hypothetical protein [Stenotrophomonas lacuserhaii]